MHHICYIRACSSKGWWSGTRSDKYSKWPPDKKGKLDRLTKMETRLTDNREIRSTDKRELLALNIFR